MAVLEKSIAEFKRQFTTSAGHILVNDAPVEALADSEIGSTQIKRAVQG